jgi:hypothetical protein
MADEVKKLTGEDITTPEMLAAEINKAFAKYNTLLTKTATSQEVRDIQATLIVENKELLTKIQSSGEQMDLQKKQIEKLVDTITIQGDTLTKMKTAFAPNENKKTFYSQVDECVRTKDFQDFIEGKTGKAKFQIETKDVAFTGTYGAGAAVQPYLAFAAPQQPPIEAFDIRLLLPTGTIDQSSLQYPMEYDPTNVAANVMHHESENGAANENTLQFTWGTAYATRIAAFIEVSRSALRNTAWLNQYITNRMMRTFIGELNQQSICGGGSAAGMAADNALKGLVDFANTFAGTQFTAKIANANYFDVLNCAKGEMNGLYNIVANTYLVNPYTGTILTSSKNTISDFVSPATFLQPNAAGYSGAFGMKQYEAADIVAGEYLVASISPSFMQLLFNGPIEILATDAHASNFIADLGTIKLEAKVLLPVYNANALMKGTFETDLATIKIS